MWAVIKVDKILSFYNFKTRQYQTVGDLRFVDVQDLKCTSGLPIINKEYTKVILDHDHCVATLLKAGLPLFLNKTDAKDAAKSACLTGFTYTHFDVRRIQL